VADLNPTQQAFVDRYAPYANLASQQLGLPSRVILAKLALETGYGTHFANNNLPGLKTGNADQNDGFGSAQTRTWEDYGGAGRTNIKDGFIKFPTPEQSIGGLVPWLSNSTYMNSLADRQGGGIFDRDPRAEASAVAALGSSGFSTDRNASAGVNRILGLLPDLSGYGIAPSFDPSVGQLMNYVPYNGATGKPNVSEGLGAFANYDYTTGTQYQPQGSLQSRERGAGLQLPAPSIGTGPSEQAGPFQSFADVFGRGLSGVASGLSDLAGGVGDALGISPAQAAEQGLPDTAGFDPRSFASGGAPDASGFGYYGGGGAGIGAGFAGGQIPSGFLPNQDITGFGQGFNPSAYLAANPDVAASGMDPLQHWLRFGQAEQRPLSPDQSPAIGSPIGAPNPIQASFGTPLSPVSTGTNVSQGVGPGTFQGTFNGAEYLAANPDVAARGMDPLQHYLLAGFQEGRALDTAGDRINQGFNASQYLAANPDVAATGLGALQHYVMAGAHEGRTANFSGNVAPGSFGAGIVPAPSMQSPMDYGALGAIDVPAPIAGGNFGSDLSPVSTGPNVSAGVGAGTFRGTFNPADYLAANPDVAAAHIDPLQHYLTSGYNEGRALDTAGDRINQGFNPSQYLAANPDVAAMGLNPLQHYLMAGAHEGRSADFSGGVAPGNFGTGITPYAPAPGATDFSASNVSQGAGPTGNGAFGLGKFSPLGEVGVPQAPPGLSVTPSTSSFGGFFNPYNFSAANVGGGLGAQPQSMGSLYPAGNSPPAGGINPYGFSQANVGGYNPNALPAVEDFGSGEGLGPTQWNDAPQAEGGGGAGSGFNSNASELAFLRGQLDQQYAANARLADSHNTNIAFANQGAAQANQLNAVGYNNAAQQSATIRAGLGFGPTAGIAPYVPPPVAPVSIATIGGIGPMNFGLAGLGGAPLRGFL